MKAIQLGRPKGPFEQVERDLPRPGRGEVRVKVEACGICHSDMVTKEGLWPGIEFPRVPGHEIAGVVDEAGEGVTAWKRGQRVGIGWHGGHCGTCDRCRRGDFLLCQVAGRITGISRDGGYAQYLAAPEGILAAVPDGLSSVEAAPLMCAGVTTFNSLRHSGARPGDTVAVLGIGGLGHLGVQYASKAGFRTVAIARGSDKEELARRLGAHEYVDSAAGDPAQALQKLGGANVILATAVNAAAMSAVLGGLAPDGTLVVLGAPHEPLQVSALLLIGARRSVRGWPSGTSIDSQDTLEFSAARGVKPMVETFPLERAQEAYDRMMSGEARFRVVLTVP